MTSPEIHKAQSRDWSAIRDICCRTGNSGDPIAAERWPFFGALWVGPYEELLPEWAYVATNGEQVSAYLTGCPDTASFKRQRFFAYDLPLAFGVVAGKYAKNADTRRFLRRTLHLEKGPEERFSKKTWQTILNDYPAHLHINADSGHRGKGVGRTLVDCFVSDLRPLGCPGVHVFCGIKPVPFYERLGFRELERIEFVPGVWVYALGLSISR